MVSIKQVKDLEEQLRFHMELIGSLQKALKAAFMNIQTLEDTLKSMEDKGYLVKDKTD